MKQRVYPIFTLKPLSVRAAIVNWFNKRYRRIEEDLTCGYFLEYESATITTVPAALHRQTHSYMIIVFLVELNRFVKVPLENFIDINKYRETII